MEKHFHPSIDPRESQREGLPILHHPHTPGRLYKSKENAMRENLAQSIKRTPNVDNNHLQNLKFRSKGSPHTTKTLLIKEGIKINT